MGSSTYRSWILSILSVGDEVTVEYKEGDRSNTVLSLNGAGKASE